MKKMIIFMLSAVMVLSLAACANKAGQTSADLEIPNPYTECETMEDAVKLVGFNMIIPDVIGNLEKNIIRIEDENKMIEVIYGSEDEKIVIRKAIGMEDISGDYTKYSESNTISVENLQVIMQGNDGKVNLATWQINGYTYSIGAYGESGISSTTMIDLISQIDKTSEYLPLDISLDVHND
ncbi:hypothetical protein [Clostridium cadaveris]|uniref:hypothetical protein n=1 Tax=Clostridium cadaveris TaxID=1529 RepID=UPI0015B708BF|nr:hypothetical protein [Clostridium cadaveris]NWK12968.1 hypothetical protein [Clostridium cadaveris]